ncbi:CPBP family intramembrane glutamic endopeptidase [Microbacterium sp.]|uniref:CPBP family intramembrane glutamic endopeptidase n=1 Tax=Microbacterium sp. TaxID=51671 RepID=UPI00260C099D|nr:CPBP family intramembrane glutamic endopeptidase [Microbacterium sp.]
MLDNPATIPAVSARPNDTPASARWALGLPLLRVVLVAAASGATWLITSAFESDLAFPPPAMLSAAAMLPVNIICLLLVMRLLRREGRTVRDLLGFDRRRIGTDLLWGLLWLAVLYLPFVGAIMLVVWVQHGSEMFVAMQTIFFDPETVPTLNPVAWSVIAVVAVITFAPLNAPTEELVYRGYAQGTLRQARGSTEARWPTVVAVIVPSIFFALQHVWYAPTPDAVVAFVCAFFVWGVGSAVIYLGQRRLMPVVFAHLLVNLLFTLPALAVPVFLSTSGV